MRKFLGLMAVFVLLGSFASAMNCTIQNATEVNKDIPIMCQTNFSIATVCLLRSYDVNANLVQGWYANPDSNGYLMRLVRFDDKYSVGNNYTLSVQCGDELAGQTILVDVGGNIGANIATTNYIAYVMAHPEEAIAFAIIALVGVMAVFVAFKFVRRG